MFREGSWSAVRSVLERHERLEAELNDPEAMQRLGPRKYAARAREMGRLAEAAGVVRTIEERWAELADLEALAAGGDGGELAEMAREEAAAHVEELAGLEAAAMRSLLPPDEDDNRNAILEVRAGTGGDEAAIFAMDLFQMYEKYADLRGIRFETLSLSTNDYGGCREGVAMLSGDDVFGLLKHETGTHRVQRVPVTETQGRVHTSAATVALLPEAEEVDVQIDERDLRIDTYRSSGKGGQSVNTTDSAVRITHIPTNTVVAIQDERSQAMNRSKAMKVLLTRVYEKERSRLQAERKELRQQLTGRGDRSERIRTYNYPQGRITDHRVNETLFGIDAMMNGEYIDRFAEVLERAEQVAALHELNK